MLSVGLTVSSVNVNGSIRAAAQKGLARWPATTTALFAPYLAERREKGAAEDREVLVCGDWNIARCAPAGCPQL